MITDIEVSVDDGGAVFLRDGTAAPPAATRPLRVLVCGGREFADYALVLAALTALNLKVVIHGAARGADALAARAAMEIGVPQIACPADWNANPRGAGMVRNRQMLRHKPDAVVAFEGGRGTANLVEVASGAGVTVYRITRKESS